jgi:hypothetical protein
MRVSPTLALCGGGETTPDLRLGHYVPNHRCPPVRFSAWLAAAPGLANRDIGLDFPLQPIAQRVHRYIQVVICLQPQPELG